MRKKTLLVSICFALIITVRLMAFPELIVSPVECFDGKKELMLQISQAFDRELPLESKLYIDHHRLFIDEAEVTRLISTENKRASVILMPWFVSEENRFRLLTIETPNGEIYEALIRISDDATDYSVERIENIVKGISGANWINAVEEFLQRFRLQSLRYDSGLTWSTTENGWFGGSSGRDQVLALWGLWRLSSAMGEASLSELYRDQLLSWTTPTWTIFNEVAGTNASENIRGALSLMDIDTHRPIRETPETLPTRPLVFVEPFPDVVEMPDQRFFAIDENQFDLFVHQLLRFVKQSESAALLVNACEVLEGTERPEKADKYLEMLEVASPDRYYTYTVDKWLRFAGRLRSTKLSSAVMNRIRDEVQACARVMIDK